MSKKDTDLVLRVEYEIEGHFGGGKVLGTFTSIQQVNYFTLCMFQQCDRTVFISTKDCPEQTQYFTDEDGNPTKLTLSEVERNPYNKIGAVRMAFNDEPRIEEIEADDEDMKAYLAHVQKSYAVYPYYFSNRISLQLWGWAINLNEDGTWFFEATDGG